VAFLSLQDLARDGVPANALVLLNAGEPGSSWSGGFHWDDPDLVAKGVRRCHE